MTPRDEPRRPSLATIVGSSLAVAAAGSLIAFGSLAEQAGLQGLAAGGLQPSRPDRSGGGGRAITVPAPATPRPEDPREALAELVRDTIQRDATARTPEPRAALAFAPAPRDPAERARPEPRGSRDLIENQARVAVTGPAPQGDAETAEPDGPPHGHAFGHDKSKHGGKAKPGKKGSSRARAQGQPVYARSTNDAAAEAPKAPKMKKVKPAKANGNGNGHAKHSHGNGKGKAKGHAKHGG